uniref:Uncharacterized protein n=1 Tax=Oryza meridionalis TaxID=40149 RepID=A0A0E0DSD4_9ORYZ
MEPCLLNLGELCHQFFRDAPVKYANVLPCPHLVVALWEHALSHLNTPAKSNLSRSFLQLLGYGNDSRMAQNEEMKRPGQQSGWHLEQHLWRAGCAAGAGSVCCWTLPGDVLSPAGEGPG